MTNSANLSIVIEAVNNTNKSLQQIRKDLAGIDGPAKKAGSSLGDVSKIAGGFVVAKALIEAPKFLLAAANAAAEDAASQARLAQAVENTGASYGKHSQQLEEVIKQGQRLAFSDDQTRDSLSLLVAQTDSVSEATKRYAIAQELARGANIDVVTASRLLGKVTDENVAVLARYGISIRKGADSTELLTAVQRKFSGQAATFADSAAGKMARFSDKVDELKEAIGSGLIPVLEKATDAGLAFVDGLNKVGGFVTSGTNAINKLLGTTNKLPGEFHTAAEAFAAAEKAGNSLEKKALLGVAAALQGIERQKGAKQTVDDTRTSFEKATEKAKDFNSSLNDLDAALAGLGKAKTPEQLKIENQLADVDKRIAEARIVLDQAERAGAKTQVVTRENLQKRNEAQQDVEESLTQLKKAQEDYNKSQTPETLNALKKAELDYNGALIDRNKVLRDTVTTINVSADAAKKYLDGLEDTREVLGHQRDLLLANRAADDAAIKAKDAAAKAANGQVQSEKDLAAAKKEVGAASIEQANDAKAAADTFIASEDAIIAKSAEVPPSISAIGAAAIGNKPGFTEMSTSFNIEAGKIITDAAEAEAAIARITAFVNSGQSNLLKQLAGSALPSRDVGGPVSAGQQSGNVIPHNQVTNNQQKTMAFYAPVTIVMGGGSGGSASDMAFARI